MLTLRTMFTKATLYIKVSWAVFNPYNADFGVHTIYRVGKKDSAPARFHGFNMASYAA